MKTIGCISLGCDKNTTDSEAMLGFLETKGYKIVHPDKANIVLVNTCAFISEAVLEATAEIRKALEQKIKGISEYVIIAGCLVERDKSTLFEQFPLIDAIINPHSIQFIDEVIVSLAKNKENNIHNPPTLLEPGTVPPSFFHHRLVSTSPHFAYLKIAEGCDNFCTYCIIPQLRGPFTSKPMEAILIEASKLAATGVKELILVAQDTALYGRDLYGESKLHELIQALSTIDFTWIRVLYTYPEHITDNLIMEMKHNTSVCQYLDIPMQHGANSILKAMNRQVTRETMLAFIQHLRSEMPDIILRTSIIVGFPGETDEDISELLDFLEEAKFDKLGVFPYSREEGTPAFHMKDQIEENVKISRMEKVMAFQQEISQDALHKHIGHSLMAMVDEETADYYIARSYMDVPEVDGAIFISKTANAPTIVPGNIVSVTITDATVYDLIGVIHEPAK